MEDIKKACPYCENGEKLNGFAYHVCDLKGTKLYLFREQSYKGRCLLVLNRHAEEYAELTKDERITLQEDLFKVTTALHKILKPGKINLGSYGDTVRHFHYHIVPKYEGELDWNGVFQMNPNKIYPSDEELELLAKEIRENL